MPTINLGRVGIVNKGDYQGGSTQYKINDICKYNGSIYICIQAHNTEHKPTETDYWSAWIDTTKFAQIDSPSFTGTPKAPTADKGTNNTQIATTEFVKTAIDNSTVKSYTQEVITSDGQTQITLNGTKGSYFSVCINGVRSGSSNWSVSGTTLTFNKALSNGDEVIIDSIA
jgi:hypothetical protein